MGKRQRHSYNPNQQNNASKYNGITLLKETNFSTTDTDLPLWDEEDGLPIKPGDTFPTQDMQRRANINKTMDALVSGDLGDCLADFIYTWPDLDPITNKRVATIVASLPIFNEVVRDWELLLHQCFKGVKVKGEDRPLLWKAVDKKLTSIIENKFICCDRMTAVFANDNIPVLKLYDDKNILICRDKEDKRIYSLTNIFTNEEGSFLEVISFISADKCLRNVFKYSAGKVSTQVVKDEVVETKAAVYYQKNGAGRGEYGQPILGGITAAALGAVRAFSTLALLVEKKREVVRVVPDAAIVTDQFSGMSAYIGGGTVGYDDKNTDAMANNHDVQFATPNLLLKEAIDTLEEMLKQVSIYSNLSGIILGYQTIGGNASGQAIAESCLPTMIAATGYIRDLKVELTRIIKRMLIIMGEDVKSDDIELIVSNPSETLVELLNLNQLNIK